MADRRPLLLLLALLLFTCPAIAQDEAQAFAGLTVVAFGDQEVDIFTGITTLPQGGQVIDRENGVALTAEIIRYQEGEFVEAQEVEVAGEFGVAFSEEVYIDLAEGRLDAVGEVRFEREEVGLTAQALHYFPRDGVVSFEGPVSGVGAEFEAAAAYFDGTGSVLLLMAPYRYQDTLFELSSDREGAVLALTPSDSDDGRLVASSRVAPDVLERLSGYIEEGKGGTATPIDSPENSSHSSGAGAVGDQ